MESKANDILSLRNAQTASDKYIHLLGKLVGHTWTSSKTYSWNRSRIQHAIHRYSYKGTSIAVEDMACEFGSEVNLRQDNASKLLILGKQGRLSCDDAYLVSADYYHDGAFLYEFKNSGDTEGLAAAILDIITAGEIWFTNFVYVSQGIFDTDAIIEFLGTLTFTEALQGTIGFGTLGGNLLLSSEPNGRMELSYTTTDWHTLGTGEQLGSGSLGQSLYLSECPAIPPEYSYDPVDYFTLLDDRALGYATLGGNLFLSIEPSLTFEQTTIEI